MKGEWLMKEAQIGIFGGSGFYSLLDRVEEVAVQTPYGAPSDRIAIAEIAGQSILTDFVRGLCSRSSLIIALYWRRRDTICESHAHHALVDAIAANSPKDATELMTSHLVDLLSGLDLLDRSADAKRLSDILRPVAGE